MSQQQKYTPLLLFTSLIRNRGDHHRRCTLHRDLELRRRPVTMRRCFCGSGLFLLLARPSVSFCTALPLSFITNAGSKVDAMQQPLDLLSINHHTNIRSLSTRRLLRPNPETKSDFASTRRHRNGRQKSRGVSALRFSGAGSTVAPPPVSQVSWARRRQCFLADRQRSSSF